jgi:periplasmic protein TonB
MKTDQLAPQLWEDIVFERRNKDYGAYVLRKLYSKNVVTAVIIMLSSIGLVFAYPYIAAFIKSQGDQEVVETKVLTTVTLDQPPPITPNQPPPPKVDVPPPIKTIKYVAPKVTKEEVVEEEMPTVEELKQVEVSTDTQEGETQVVFEEPVKAVVVEEDEDKIFTVVEQTAEFPGGMAEMYKFLGKNLRYPGSARRMGVNGKAFVQFVVDREGRISDIEIIKSLSPDCDKEAIRVVQLMPPWKSARQNGRNVKSKFVLPITFKLEN